MSIKQYRYFIFDLDDTLCECNTYYMQKKNEFAAGQAERTGLTSTFCLDLLTKIDTHFMSLPSAFRRERFPRSFSATSAALDLMLGKNLDEDAAEQSYILADTVFQEPYELYDDVHSNLTRLKTQGARLFMLTKGDYAIQMNKIVKNNLEQYFSKDKIYIVGQKSPDNIEQIINNHKLTKEHTIMVGDSPKDDMRAAIGAGIDSLQITRSKQPKSPEWPATYHHDTLNLLHQLYK